MPIKTKRTDKLAPQVDALVKQAQKLSGLKKKEEVLSQALRIYVEHLEKPANNGSPSFYELTKHLAGSVRGPSDLAHNKKHMQGFGQ